MAAPTQQLPPWLSYSTFITRGATSSTLVELPLTYYGPSIPLGTNGVWTYGGLTSPASSPTSRTSTSPTATPTPSTTPRPTTTSGSASITETSGSTSSPTSSPTASSSLPASSSESVSSSTATPSIPISSASLSSSATPSLSSLSSASTASSTSLSSVSVLSSTSIITSSIASISSASGTSTSSASTAAVGPTSSAQPTPPASGIRSSINKPALIGIVLGSIFGTVLLLLLLLLCLRWRRRRQNGNYQTPIWTGWEIVDPSAAELGNNGEERSPGEGSPRGSGEEADSFLRRSGGPQNMADIGRSISIPAPAALAGVAAGVGAAAPHQGTNNSNGSGSSGGRTESTAVSDYGVLLADYTNARRSSEMGQGYFDDAEPRSRHIISPSELLRLENERMEAEHIYGDAPGGVHDPDPNDPARYSPLAPPPPLVDPERHTPEPASSKSSFSIISAQEQEDPVVMSARRVHMSDVGPRGSERGSEESSPVASTSGGWGALGLGGIARLSRLSWFKNFRENLQDSPPTRPQSYVGVALSDNEMEAGRATLGRDLKRPGALGLDAAGERPISTVSTKSAMSGSTVYHDAHSAPGTPPPLPPMPRVYMSLSHPELHSARSGSTMSPPAYESEHMGSLAGQAQAAKDAGYAPRLVDVLDMPAPVSMSQFSSISSRGGMPFPPGLLPTPRSWYESSSSEAEGADVTIDVLEDAPPQARDGWRVLARNGSIAYPEHRSSFGIPQFVHPHDMGAISEMGSLHSMRSHLSPLSGRSSGSAPASSRHRLDGSNSSRPSGHSAQASSGRSLAHSGSISSDGQRRLRGNVSPSLSAFGPQDDINSPDISAQFPSPPPPPPPYLPRSPLVGLHDTAIRDTYSPGSSHTSHELTYGDHDGPFSPDSQLLAMPWATGFDHED